MHIGLLACDEVAERFRHIAGGYQQMFERLLSPHIPGLRVTRFDVQAGDIPVDARACDAWITTGSRASVYDDAAWIRSVEAFVRNVAEADRPFVGICSASGADSWRRGEARAGGMGRGSPAYEYPA